MKVGVHLPNVLVTPKPFVCLLAVFLLGTFDLRIRASGTLTNADAVEFRTAIEQGGTVRLAFDGTVLLTNSIRILTTTTVDASGRSVSLDAQNKSRHFQVTNGATLRLINLTLANGRFVGTNGLVNEPGETARGGSIFCDGGALELSNCTLATNHAIGGKSAPASMIPGCPGALGCLVSTNGGAAYGGAIYVGNGEIRMTQCSLTGNTCEGGLAAVANFIFGTGGDYLGGAIFATNADISLQNVSFIGNEVRFLEVQSFDDKTDSGLFGIGSGGALFNVNTSATLSNCIFKNNQVLCNGGYSSGGASGGAIWHDGGSLTVEGSFLSSNLVTAGEAGAVRGAIGGGGLPGYGGAIYIGTSAKLRIGNSALAGNQAVGGQNTFMSPLGVNTIGGDGIGGAIYSRGALAAENCTFAGNTAQGGKSYSVGGSAFGGALWGSSPTEDEPMSFVNVTFSGNAVYVGEPRQNLSLPATRFQEAFGASIYYQTDAFPVAVGLALTNSILSCGSGQTNVHGLINDGGHNICSDGSAKFVSATSWNDLDPLLGQLADNGGPTPTCALLPGSPAIDAGDVSVCPAMDQRGVARPQGLACDIGAFELAPKLTLTRASEGSVELVHQFQAGYTNRLSASTDLVAWLPLATLRADTNGVVKFEDPAAAQLPRRFYRVQVPGAR